ncbi:MULTISPECIES: DUF1840 domain-containing protein [Comamonas]|jgi:hypothetical protein|uniref:DUF1840 domain-containing protein n=1 Tax=Comamonas jiangduensis TaxID=1194168 RepID=A0ABV4IBN4_9BURK|nr:MULTISPECIES: DUF1840 domain-containing protein [Comamonas]QXW18134.1 DUF1840 domain-containing protein [Comamonas aquatica]
MAYTFQSRATADLIMLKAAAEQILKLLDKPLHEAGILTVEQIPAALATLEKAVLEDDARRQAIKEEMDGVGESSKEQESAAAADSAKLGPVSLRQRVAPLADMLRRSAAEGKPVTWAAPK